VSKNAYNCIYLFRKLIRIVWEVRRAIQKHELSQKFQGRTEELDDSLMMDDMDINAMLDDSKSDIQSVVSEQNPGGMLNMTVIMDQSMDRMSEYNKTEADFD
jgi:hypothetical protein